MLAEISSMGTMLLVNLLFSSIALAIGFAAGVWMFGPGAADRATNPRAKDKSDIATQLATERAMMAFQRIQDLAKGMASDAGDHASKMQAITYELETVAVEQPGGMADAVFTAVGRIVEANTQLQQRLSVAEKQIEKIGRAHV